MIFTDAEAARMIEELNPNLAEVIKVLVKKGESPQHIKTVSRSAARGNKLIPELVEGAAFHYRSNLKCEQEP